VAAIAGTSGGGAEDKDTAGEDAAGGIVDSPQPARIDAIARQNIPKRNSYRMEFGLEVSEQIYIHGLAFRTAIVLPNYRRKSQPGSARRDAGTNDSTSRSVYDHCQYPATGL